MASPNDPERSLGFLLHDLSRLLRRNFTRRIAHLGLTPVQWQCLAHLARQEGVNQTTLADTLEVQPITLARLIDRLQESGWVERRSDPQDRRAFRLYLTAKAQPLLAVMWQTAAETRAEATAGLPEAARERLIDALVATKRNLIEAEQRVAKAAEPTGNEAKRAQSS